MLTILADMPIEAVVASETSFPASIELPTGLIGFPELTRFDVLPADEQGPFLWLRPPGSDDPATGFLMLPPGGYIPDYRLELFDEDAEWLGIGEQARPWVFNIVTLQPGAPERATINLIGPIVVRRQDGVGKQVILANHQQYSALQPLVEGAQ